MPSKKPQHETTWERLRSHARTGLLLSGVAVTASVAGLAHADTIKVDKDSTDSANKSVSLGTLSPGSSITRDVDLIVNCDGQSHALPGSSLTFTTSTNDQGVASGTEVTPTSNVLIPASWPADGTGCGTGQGKVADYTGTIGIHVVIPADAAPGVRSVKVTYSAKDGDVNNPVHLTANYVVGAASTPPDTTAPGKPEIDLVSTSDSGVSSTDDTTNDATPTFSGTAEPLSTVTLYDGDAIVGTANADASGNWTYTVINAAAFTDGTHTMTVKATDAADNTSVASDALPVLIDTIAPTVTPDSVASTTWRNSSLAQTFTSSDTGSGLADAADDTSFTLTASAESTLDGLGAVVPTVAGPHSVFDVAGNATQRSVSAWIDLTNPTATEENVVSTTWRNTSLSQTFHFSDALSGLLDSSYAAKTVTASADSTLDANGNVVPTVASDTAYDKAGNSLTRSVSAQIDTVKPDLHITGAADGTNTDLCTSGPLTSPAAAPTDALSGLNAALTSISWTTPGTASGAGTYTFGASATDNATNTASETRTYKALYSGAYTGPLQPINADGSSRFKLGSTVPFKFTLKCNGVPITNAVARLFVAQGDAAPDPGVDEAISTSAATTGNLFRYDVSGAQYIFNLNTKSGYLNPDGTKIPFTTQGTYTLKVGLDDGTFKSVKIQLVK